MYFFHLDTDNIVFSLIVKSDNQNSTSQAKIAKVDRHKVLSHIEPENGNIN